ncbi:FtsX-like permease family protein [Trebonia kvetii]|uniref:FtsX-like permease family protein n=1 Tax=Trebonia kvetii TaxID=2480626 RepID=A0A6P2C172_9ACTN|nr:FtsX family ABC transporter permease [Trebonia kvetii]TVZ05114.1 FtsX-like permease family protein [Trebonia kvetii]
MFNVVLRGLWARKSRAVLTMLAVVLGVAMISGTFVLMDTVMSAYSGIFNTAYEHTDAVVTAQSPFGAIGSAKQPVPASLLYRIRALPETQKAHGYIDSHAQLTSAAGTAIARSSEEASVFGLPARELDAMNPLGLVSGTWPSGPGEIIIDQATATRYHLRVGTTVGLVARKPLERFRVTGIFRFAGATALGPTQFAAVDLAVAQRIFGKQGWFDEIDIAARPGISVSRLLTVIRGIAPPGVQVKTAAQQASTATSDVGQQFAPLRYALLAFGAIALLVGSFVIFNTLSITVAQRTRQLATLRTLGASRRQVLASVLAEGTIIGAASSLAGLAAGIGAAKGLSALLGASGIQLPAASTVLTWRTAAISLTAGIAVTLAASGAPALRAMRIAPIAAIREGTAPPPRSRLRRPAVTAAATILGAGALVPAVVLGGLPVATRLLLLAGGALVLFTGVAGASRWFIGPLAAAIEKPVEHFTRAAGELAREQTRRSPARTATTAAALTVGVALIAFVAVMAQGVRASTGISIRQQVAAGYVITPQGDVLAPDVQHALAAAGIRSASVRAGTVHAFGTNQAVTGVAPADIARSYRFEWTGGPGSTALTSLDADGVLVASDFAAAHHLKTGTLITAETTAGTILRLTVRGVYAEPKLSPLLGAMTVTTSLFDRSFTTPGDKAVLVSTGTQRPAGRAAVQAALKPFPTAQVDTLDEYITAQQAPVATLLNVFYVLLALCVVISLLGIINTLALTITERTREIGVLRALGMTRTQLRRMIRIESQITALIGAATGIAAGLFLAALTARALSAWNIGFAIPWTTLAILLAGAFAAGTLAGAGPARRAARMDPLQALSYE